MKVAFCGFGRAGRECLNQLFVFSDLQIEDVYVFTHKNDNTTFLQFLEDSKIKYTTSPVNKNYDLLNNLTPDFLVSVYYKSIISDNILKLVNYRAMNLHPSLLPDYKGCFSSVWAILNGASKTGISFHYMTEHVDSGNILLQKELIIKKWDTAYSLYHKLVSYFIIEFYNAFKLLVDGFDGYAQSKGGPQRYYDRALPYNGVIKAESTKFDFAEKFVRAMYFPPHPGAKFIINKDEVEITYLDQLDKYKHYFK